MNSYITIRGIIPNEGVLMDLVRWAVSHRKEHDGVANSKFYTWTTDRQGVTRADRLGVELTVTLTCTALKASVAAISAIKAKGGDSTVLGRYLDETQVFGTAEEMLGQKPYSVAVPVFQGRQKDYYYGVVKQLRKLLYEEVEARLPSPLQAGLPSEAMVYDALMRVVTELPQSGRKYLEVTGYRNGVRLVASAMEPLTDTAENLLDGRKIRRVAQADMVVSSVRESNGALDTSGIPLFVFKHQAAYTRNPRQTAKHVRNKMVMYYVEEQREIAEKIKKEHAFVLPDEHKVLVPIIKAFKAKFRQNWRWRKTYAVPWEPRDHPDDRPEPAKLIKGWGNNPDKRMAGCIIAFWIFSRKAVEGDTMPLTTISGIVPPPLIVPGTELEEYRWVAYTYDQVRRENLIIGQHGNWESDAPIPEPFAYKEFKVGADGRQALALAREWKRDLDAAAGVAHTLRVRSEFGRIEEERREAMKI